MFGHKLLLAALIFSISIFGQSVSFNTFRNPVIPGDHPDCTVTRIGNDFYTTGSSFNVTPVIYHSTDLVHWRAIAQPVSAGWSGYGDTPGGGCWGGHFVFYNGEYWHFFSRANTMHFTKAPAPEGPWSTPVKINNPTQLPYSLGYDNSIFIDDDNKMYLVVKNGQPNNGIVELGTDGQPTGVVYNLNWLNPSPDYPYSWAEGPVMWKYRGYYYYSFARDLSGGQKVMRSKTLTADSSSWTLFGDFFNENDPAKSGSLFTSPNHASPVVTLDDSTFWVIHPIYAKDQWKGQGRQGLLNQVQYDSSGRPVADYPVNKAFTAPVLPSGGIPWMVPHSDFFNSNKLNPEWSFLGYTLPNKYSLSERPGWFKLTPKSSTRANTIIKNDGEHNYSLITRLDFTPVAAGDEAGLWIMRGDETMSLKLVSTLSNEGVKIVSFSFNGTSATAMNNFGDTLWLKLERINHIIKGYFSGDGINWINVEQQFDISNIDSFSDFSTFTGTRQGLYVSGKISAYFDFYIYRDAYSEILAECPANQYGVSVQKNTLSLINNGDWALYAGVEFGNDEYKRKPDSVSVLASCTSTGGIIEFWLDSIDTGTKIAECPIENTGSWNTYNVFKTAITEEVTDYHDLYLRFTGSGLSELYKIKSFIFSSTVDSVTSVGDNLDILPGKFLLEQNYPNPFNPSTIIRFSLPAGRQELPMNSFVNLRVFDILGREVATLVNEQKPAGNYEVKFDASHLSSGIYIYKLTIGNLSEEKKMMLLK